MTARLQARGSINTQVPPSMNEVEEVVVNGGASSIKRSSKEPLCEFDPEHGFSIDESQVRMLRWYDQDNDGTSTRKES